MTALRSVSEAVQIMGQDPYMGSDALQVGDATNDAIRINEVASGGFSQGDIGGSNQYVAIYVPGTSTARIIVDDAGSAFSGTLNFLQSQTGPGGTTSALSVIPMGGTTTPITTVTSTTAAGVFVFCATPGIGCWLIVQGASWVSGEATVALFVDDESVRNVQSFSGATATITGPWLSKGRNRGAQVTMNLSAITGTSPSVNGVFHGYDPLQQVVFTLLSGDPSVTATGAVPYRLYPGIGSGTHYTGVVGLPLIWRFVLNVAASTTISGNITTQLLK